ncbi:MAG: hypothetical protein JOZ53_25715 [Planctomycetaceae bacterium]|nr:hypothetical protein [Planctomycetaceae bacterium]
MSYRRLKATASRATHAAARDVTAHRPDPCRPTRAGRGSAWELSRDSPVAKPVSDPTSCSVGDPRDRLQDQQRHSLLYRKLAESPHPSGAG